MSLELAASDLETNLGVVLVRRPTIVIRRTGSLNFRASEDARVIWLDFFFLPVLDGLFAGVAFGTLHELSHLYFRFTEPVEREAWANFGALYALRKLMERPFPLPVKLSYLYKDYFATIAFMQAALAVRGETGQISKISLRIWRILQREGVAKIRQILEKRE